MGPESECDVKSGLHIDQKILLSCGTEYIEVCSNKISNQFWKDTFKSWKIITNHDMLNITPKLHLCLWFNKNITIGNKYIFYKDWYDKGVLYISDLIGHDKQFYSLLEFKSKYNIDTNFLTYHGLIHSIKNKKLTDSDFSQFTYYLFLKNSKGAKDMYNVLLSSNKHIPSALTKWKTIFPLSDNEWKLIYKLPFKTTLDSKMQWFQTRINHRIVGTNWLLNKINSKNNHNCCFCRHSTETIEHLLYECKYVQTLLPYKYTL